MHYWLILVLLSIVSGFCHAQRPSPTNRLPPDLIRKIDWMEKRGFPAREYQWNNPAINEHLQQALAYRKPAISTVSGAVLTGAGGIISTGGLIGLLITSIANDALGWDEDLTRYGIMSGVGLAAFGGGIAIIVNGAKKGRRARQELQLANELYQPSR